MSMKKVALFTMFLVGFLSAAAVCGAWAQSQSPVGVKTGDNFTYSFNVNWVSSNENVQVPQELSQLNQTMWIHVDITDASESAVGVNISRTLRDGTKTPVEIGFLGMLSGSGTPNIQLFIIPANLTAGQQSYPMVDPEAVAAGAAPAPFTINETITRTYLGVARAVNHFSETNSNATTGDSGQKDVYYDQKTGVLLEMTTTHYTASLDETDTERWLIVQFNNAGTIPSDGGSNDGTNNNGSTSNGSLPDLLTLTLIGVVVAIIVVFAALIVVRQRKKPAQTPPAAPVSGPPQTPT